MRRHLKKQELLAYAEGLADTRAAMDLAVAGHIGSCARCAAEVERMRATLAIAAAAPALEPDRSHLARVLLAAQRERKAGRGRFPGLMRSALRLAAVPLGSCAATGLVLCGLLWGAPEPEPGGAGHSAWTGTSEALQEAAGEVRVLASAASRMPGESLTPWQRQQWRAVKTYEADIAESVDALKRNPGCARAMVVVSNNLERQAQTLRSLYANKDL